MRRVLLRKAAASLHLHIFTSHITSSHLTSAHLTSSFLTFSHLTSSHLTSSHLTSSHLLSSDLHHLHILSSSRFQYAIFTTFYNLIYLRLQNFMSLNIFPSLSGQPSSSVCRPVIGSAGEEALESSYELCFNAACALIDEGRLKEAEARKTRGAIFGLDFSCRKCDNEEHQAQLARAKQLCTEELVQAQLQFSSGLGSTCAQNFRLKMQLKQMPACWRITRSLLLSTCSKRHWSLSDRDDRSKLTDSKIL